MNMVMNIDIKVVFWVVLIILFVELWQIYLSISFQRRLSILDKSDILKILGNSKADLEKIFNLPNKSKVAMKDFNNFSEKIASINRKLQKKWFVNYFNLKLETMSLENDIHELFLELNKD